MKITFNEVLSRKEWIHTEMLNSLTGDLIHKASKDQFYNVKLLINGVEVEPTMFNDIMNNVEKHIDKQAEYICRDKISELENKTRRLDEIIQDAIGKIREEFDVYDRED